MSGISHLKGLQALELAIRKGSLKAAAAELSITPAALGQRIKSLEDYLGYDLLVRGRSGIRATKELSSATAHLSAAFRELETVARLLDFQRINEIHLTADSDWAELWLAPRLIQFQEQNPNTLFCINGVGDVATRFADADCEIFFGDAQEHAGEDLLYVDYLLPVTSPAIKKRICGSPSEEMLEGLPLLHLDCYTTNVNDMGWTDWIRRFGHRRTAPGRGIRYQRVLHALEAVYADAGFIICGISLVTSQLDNGSLTLPFPLEQGQWSKHAYRARFQAASLQKSAVQNFRAWLLDESQRTAKNISSSVSSS